MISQVTFFVAHNDDTDAFQDFVETTAREYASGDIVMLDYDVIVDVPDPTSKVSSVNRIMDLLGPTSFS